MNVGLTCGVIYGFSFMNDLAGVNVWEIKCFEKPSLQQPAVVVTGAAVVVGAGRQLTSRKL